jgi:chorismate mutase/prephenate dehydrogenase
MSLEDLRDRLNEIDAALVELMAQRQHVVAEVSAHKIGTGTPTRDYARERDVLERVRAMATKTGFDADVAESIMRLLIRSSLTHQERKRVAAQSAGVGRRALVIGGSGKMGMWMAEFLASQGFAIEIADPTPNAAPYPRVDDWTELTLDHDVIVVATPIQITARTLTTLAARQPTGLVFDVGSLKTPLKQGLEALRDAGCRVASLHPMFGPDTQLLSGRHVIFIDLGDSEATRAARDLFASTMAELVDMSLEEHDRLIGYILGLSHALNLVFFTALAESGELVPKLKRLSSTTFDAQLAVASRVAGDNPHLYFEIQSLNEFGDDALEALVSAASRIRDLVATKDEPGFVRLMEAGRDYLARDESLDKLAER